MHHHYQGSIKPNFTRFCNIQHSSGGNLVFHDIRDFTWHAEDKTQQQHRIDDTYNADDIIGAYLLHEPFGLGKLVAHSMISFHFRDGRKLCLSIEAQLQEKHEYSFVTAALRGYRIMYIRGTEKDHVSLRTDLRKGVVAMYPLHLSVSDMRGLFNLLVRTTNQINHHDISYSLIMNNCTTALWNVARKYFGIKKRHRSLLLARFLPSYLARLGVVIESEKVLIFK